MQPSIVAVIDDDESVREALPDLIRIFGYETAAFHSAEEFLSASVVEQAKCLVLDIAMPGMSGVELQRELLHRGRHIPIVFITANSDDQICERLRRKGEVECLLKPFSDADLLEALNALLKP